MNNHMKKILIQTLLFSSASLNPLQNLEETRLSISVERGGGQFKHCKLVEKKNVSNDITYMKYYF